MNFNQIRYVIVTAEEKNITRASEKLFISQPSLSISINNLEEELGQKLFIRKGKGLELTYAGQLFYDWAKTVDGSRLRLDSRFEELRGGLREKITIGLSPHRSVLISPLLLKKVFEKYDSIELEIVERPAYILRDMLAKDELDLIIDTPLDDTMIYHYEEITEEGLCLLAPESYMNLFPFSNLKKDEEVDLKDLEDFGFLLTGKDSKLGQAAKKMMELAGISPKIICRCSMSETIRNMVKEEIGVAIVSDAFYHEELQTKGVRCFRIKDSNFKRKIGIAYKIEHYHSKIFYELVDVIKETFIEIYC